MEQDIIELDQLGLFATGKCKRCGAGLRPVTGRVNKVICLNACHLSDESRERYHALMKEVAAKANDRV